MISCIVMKWVEFNGMGRDSLKIVKSSNIELVSRTFISRQWILDSTNSPPYEWNKSTGCHELREKLMIFIFTVRKLRKGNVFTSVCQEFCPQGGGVHRHTLGRHPSADTPLNRHPPGRHTYLGRHPRVDGYCCGRHASYWNAFLFYFLHLLQSKVKYHRKWFRFDGNLLTSVQWLVLYC